jgi:hypothetical protein
MGGRKDSLHKLHSKRFEKNKIAENSRLNPDLNVAVVGA